MSQEQWRRGEFAYPSSSFICPMEGWGIFLNVTPSVDSRMIAIPLAMTRPYPLGVAACGPGRGPYERKCDDDCYLTPDSRSSSTTATSCCEEGGEGLCKGEARRRRNVLRDKIQKITKLAIRRLACRGRVKCILGLIYDS
ncbi:hypothetical protein KIN20_020331 [Parelaphostrongylus tenuis]|uniref:Histone H4 n=1 Tax=Parelaphostrongylus tenuis TaxID=148309 RepID=A0AAD5MSR0_PARTN|nr:hypothetical protein KIN20_020331 [Parelaphostrongylus tenuis]